MSAAQKHAGGRPPGQFDYNCQQLIDFLKYGTRPCRLTEEELTKQLAPLVAGKGTALSSRQVNRWLKALVGRGEIKIVVLRWRVYSRADDSGKWRCRREIHLEK